jgi:acyl transferase domain-containing protein/NADP-dependent 3-hydroxy acid dehydrogenase YdfG
LNSDEVPPTAASRPAAATPLAVVGIACLFPKADGFGAYWANIKNRVDAITPVPPTHWRSQDYHDPDPKSPDRVYTARGGFLDAVDFAPGDFGIAPNDLEATDTAQLLGLVVAREAFRDAERGAQSAERQEMADAQGSAHRAPRTALDAKRTAVILGVTGTLELVIPLGARLGHPIWRRALQEAGVAASVADDVVRRIGESYVGWQENSFPGLLGNVVAGRIANRLDLGGTNCVVDAACASSLSAVHLAALELQSGRADAVVTGGVDTFNDIFMYTCFSKTPALSPTGDARPFDAAGDGTILGEGLGMVVLKRLADAERDGDRIYAVIRGMGTSSDGKGNAVYAPKTSGQVAALRSAYETADIDPTTVELIEGHGTGTRVGDATEASALAEVFGAPNAKGPWCALGSVKSQIGHTKAAAGAAGLIKAIAALYHKVIPPTVKVREPLPQLRGDKTPFYVNTDKRPWLPSIDHPRRAAVSAFGFGGSNFHCVLEEARADKVAVDWDGDVQIVALTGDTPEAVDRQLADWPTELKWESLRVQAKQTRQAWRADAPCRLLLVVQRDRTDLARVISAARAGLKQNKTTWRTPDGAFFGSGPAAGKLCLLFPGQGAQYPGMLRDLACQFPAALDTLANAERAFSAAHPGEPRLSDRIYPLSAFAADERAANESALRATDVAQPALGAVGLLAWRVLERFGVSVDAAAGHSYGELTALCAAGRLNEAAFHTVSNLRGKLMASAPPGGMLAVQASAAAIDKVLREAKLDLTIANKNAPEQTVLSGRPDEIDKAAALLASRGLRAQKLRVAGAFHSPLVADASQPLGKALERIDFSPARFPVFANTTAGQYPDDAAAARHLLANQLARPVEFVKEIEALHQFGVRTFLEVGPGARLSGLVSATLRDTDAVSVDASAGQRSGIYDLACVLATIASRGHAVDLTAWDGEFVPEQPSQDGKRPKLTVPICGANYVRPRTPRPPAAQPPEPPTAIRADDRARPSPASPLTTPVHVATPPVPAVALEKRTVSNQTTPAPVAADALARALQLTRESLAAVQKMQEQTANLHRQFLEGQETAQRSLQALIDQQQRLLQASLGSGLPTVTPTAAPAPAVAAVPPPAPAPMPEAPPTRVFLTGPALAPPPAPPRPAVSAVAPAMVAAAPVAPRAAKAAVAVAPSSRIERVLIEVVAEKTGYPAEMLDPGMALDSDLGIDSIKRVEILSAIQERLPEAPAPGPEHLGTLHTLREIVNFLAGEKPAVAQPVVAAPPPAAVSAPQSADAVMKVLVDVVAQKTGYPAEMLDPDMALDSDLGIDSIKRVEILSAIQERLPEAPTVGPEHIGTLHSLRHIAEFLAGRGLPTPAFAPFVATTATTTYETPAPAVVQPRPAESVDTVPIASLQSAQATLDRSVLQVEPLTSAGVRPAVHLPPRSEIWVAPDDDELAGCLEQQLRRLGYETRLLSPVALREEEPPPSLGGLVLVAPSDPAGDALLRDALRGLQRVAPSLRHAGKHGGAILATVSRVDGAFGLRKIDPSREPVDAGLAGLTKTASHEWPEVRCKAIDVGPRMDAAAAAVAVAAELFLAGPIEVGIAPEGRCTLRRVAEPLSAASGSEPFAPGDVIVVSGGGRGVTAAAALSLAQRFRPTLVLLGRSPAPKAEPDWLVSLTSEADIKRELAGHLNGSVTPKLVGNQYAKIMAARETRKTLECIEAVGAKAVYLTVDVRQPKAVAALLAAVREEYGPVRGIIHGAGVLADARLEDKTDDQFERVYSTKVDGLRSLLAAVDPGELKALVLFSSSTGRFGRVGQADYAIANEVLNKIARQQAARLPGCRVLALNWGPWDGGMVNSSLKTVFAKEGLALIPTTAGAEHLLRELTAAGPSAAEVVVLGGPLPEPAVRPVAAPAVSPSLSVAFDRILELVDHPILESHVLDGRPVLPMAMMFEWLAHAALHQNPGLAFHGCNELRVLHGVILADGPPPELRVLAGKALRKGSGFVAPVELHSRRPDGKDVLHARGEVVLVSDLPPAPSAAEPPTVAEYNRRKEDIYRSLLFHGRELQGIDEVEGCSEQGIIVHARTAPAPASWLRQPLRQKWLTDPLAIDCAFQALILWSLERRGAAGLPCLATTYRQYRRSFPPDGVRIVARVNKATNLHALADIEFLDADGKLVARLEGYESVIDAGLQRAFRRNRLAPAAVP